jgi:MFS family permease
VRKPAAPAGLAAVADSREPARALGAAARRGASALSRRLTVSLGGPERTRVVLTLAAVLALSSADVATVGASATQLRQALHIDNTDIGFLVAVNSLVGAFAAVPFGVLADRLRRTWTLSASIVLWGAAMLWSAAATSFGKLLLARLFLGVVTAAAGPAIASLVGDYFPGDERGRIYSFILTGELVGAGLGFAVTGDVAALSWRAAFVILALPAFALAWAVARLPEPARGSQSSGLLAPGQAAPASGATDAQELALRRGIAPDPALAAQARPGMGFVQAVRHVLAVRTNVALIVSSACGYYFLAGVQTFGVEFAKGQYRLDQALANLLLLAVGGGAAVGVMAGGPLTDALLGRGRLTARITVPAVAASATVVLFIPALLARSALAALPYIILAGAMLSAQNPPIDAARLDIMPAWLWGRAEGVRTFLRTAAQALAPLVFGAFSDHLFGGGRSGLQWTFVIMLVPLAASAYFLFRARASYARDVATAAASYAQATGPAPWPAPAPPRPAGPGPRGPGPA